MHAKAPSCFSSVTKQTVYRVTDASKVKPCRAKGWAEMKQNANEVWTYFATDYATERLCKLHLLH